MSKERNLGYLKFLKLYLSKDQKILDLACGYGRLTFPLAQAGYKIEGIDLAPNFIKDAKKLAKQKRINLKFRTGNMLKLPYKDNSFNSIICMWSSFNHLLAKKDQIKALNEMFRILKNGGFAIIDMPNYKVIRGKHLVEGDIAGFKNTDFIHNKASLMAILNKSNVKFYKIKIQNIGEPKRLVLFIYK
jgi:ubiquinone/menaquinone biosynthesis C-methylase UbiE